MLTRSGVASLILPVTTLALYQTAWTAQLVFSQMQTELKAPYILPARARGFSEWHLATRHALPNSLGPVISLTGLQFGHALTFAIVTESIFQWPGLGALFVDAVAHADLPVISAYIMLTGALFIALSGLVDVANTMLNPTLGPRNARLGDG